MVDLDDHSFCTLVYVFELREQNHCGKGIDNKLTAEE